MPGYARDPNVGAGGTSIVSFQDEPPSSPTLGQIWVDSNTNIFYADSNDYLSNLTASALYVSKASASSTYALKTLYQSASTAGSGSGQLWMDSVNNILYFYNGTNWTQTTTPVNAFQLNTKVVDANYTLGSQYNAISAGPITINSGVTVEIPSGSTWVIV